MIRLVLQRTTGNKVKERIISGNTWSGGFTAGGDFSQFVWQQESLYS